MATTPIQALPYPLPGDPADGPAQIKALAEAVEKKVVMTFPSTAARDAALPAGTRLPGMMAYITGDDSLYIYRATGWRLWLAPGSVVTIADYADVKIRILAIDASVTVWAEGTISVASLERKVVGPTNVVPVGFRPPVDTIGAVEHRWLIGGGGTLTVDAFGTVYVWNPASSTSASWAGSVSYTRAVA